MKSYEKPVKSLDEIQRFRNPYIYTSFLGVGDPLCMLCALAIIFQTLYNCMALDYSGICVLWTPCTAKKIHLHRIECQGSGINPADVDVVSNITATSENIAYLLLSEQ